MKKLNKKGFTLIEMLVVIAIIAILVAIIIPTVSSATTKAAAATNAANLRSMVAEATTDYLAGTDDTAGFVTFAKSTGVFDATNGPKSKKCGTFCEADITATITRSDTTGEITAQYGAGKTVAYFSAIADTGSEPTT